MSERQIIQKNGVTYVICGKEVISKWLSKPVYMALKESGKYHQFMSADTLKLCDEILNNRH